MLSSAEALRLEIDIARIVAECAASKDPEQRARLQERLAALGSKRDPAERSRASSQSASQEVSADLGEVL